MLWKSRLGIAGWLGLVGYAWVAEPVLVATVLLYLLVPAMLVLAVLAIASGAKRSGRERRRSP